MSFSSSRRLVLALLSLIVAAIVAAELIEPDVTDPASVALAAALIAPPIVALGALFTRPFDDDTYLRDRWPVGVLGDVLLIAGSSAGIAAGIVGVATAIDRPGLALPAVAIGTYFLAMGVFTARNMTFYDQSGS